MRSRLGRVKRRVIGGNGQRPGIDLDLFRWSGASTADEAVAALATFAKTFTPEPPDWVLSVGDGGTFHSQLNAALTGRGVSYRAHATGELDRWSAADVEGMAAVICAYPDTPRMTALARLLTTHPVFIDARFEYASGLDPEQMSFGRLDEYRDTWFISPVLLESPSPYELYEESLTKFEQKCGLRDYLDLYQWLKTVVENDIPGDVAEFGSYKGHSGYLIARTLDALGSNKRLYMFDTFEGFPVEPLGVDHFWSETHGVDYDEVKAKLAPFERVTIVKGDFTQTLPDTGVGPLSVAYIDCDSYRATSFLFDALLPDGISRGGVIICEDYGHPALLGNRVAVHESLDGRSGFLRFFSQFSGFYVAVKL